MKHRLTITYSGESAKGTFDYHYGLALYAGAKYFEFCDDHAEDLLEITIDRSIVKVGNALVDTVTYDIVYDDNPEDEYDDCGDTYHTHD